MTKCKMRWTAEESGQRRLVGMIRAGTLCAHCRVYKVPGPCKQCGAKKD